MLNQNYDPQDLVVDIKNVCTDYDSSVISCSIKVRPSREPLVKGWLSSEKFQNFHFKHKLPLLREIIKMITRVHYRIISEKSHKSFIPGQVSGRVCDCRPESVYLCPFQIAEVVSPTLLCIFLYHSLLIFWFRIWSTDSNCSQLWNDVLF